jgi:geranylgeranyl diphosphate synthase, type II
MTYDTFLGVLEKKLNHVFSGREYRPIELYDPQRYILSLGGKRLRPLLALIASDLFSADFKKSIPAAICVNYFIISH